MRRLREYAALMSRYVGPQRSEALAMGLLLLLSIGLQLAGPRLVQSFIDQAMGGSALRDLVRTAALFMGVSLGAQAVRVLATYWSERVAWGAANALRIDLAAHLLRLDMGFHKQHTPGELIERVDGDVGALAGFFSSFSIHLVGSLLLLLGILAAFLGIHPLLGLVFTLLSLLMLAGFAQIRRWAAPSMLETREHSAGYYGYLGEVMGATEDIRSAGAASYALRKMDTLLTSWFPVERRAVVWSQMVWVCAMAVFAVAEAVAYGLGGALYLAGGASLGTLYLAVAYAAMLGQPLELIRTQLQSLQKADAAITRVRALLRVEPSPAEGVAELPSGALSVSFEQVHFCYDRSGEGDDAAALTDLNFTLPAGGKLAILGRTGSGKSTLARLLVRQYDPVGGRVLVGGVDLCTARLSSVRSRVALVTQEVQLFAGSLRENMTLFDESIGDQRLMDLLAELGLQEWVASLPQGLDTPLTTGGLSAGEAQLVAFARVFLRDPGLVILDEASSRLDPATEALLGRAIGQLLAGRTAVIIAHRLAAVEQVDQVLILEDGRLVECGERDGLAADPASHYARLRQKGNREVPA